MKKTFELKKKLEFSTMIGEVSAISLENHLEFVDSESVKGYLTVLGRYKSTAASRLEEDFQEDIPVEIALTTPVDPKTGKIDVCNFYYDVVDGESILCNIEMAIEAEDLKEEIRECDGDPMEEKEIEIPHIEEELLEDASEEKEKRETKENSIQEEVVEENSIHEEVKDEKSYLFNIDTNQESYGTFIVYMVRQNETINSIIEKYHTSIEEIEKYNDIKDLSIGSKIIIPVSNEQDS